MKTINKILTVLALAAAFVLPASAAEMYYNRLSKGEEVIPAGEYGDIVVPEGGYAATKFGSSLDTISQATDDWGGSYAGIITKVGSNYDLMDHTISGWFKVPTKTSGDTTLCVEKTASSYANSRGNAIRVSAAGKLLVGKVKHDKDAWQGDDTHIASTDTLPTNEWFYLTVNFTVDHSTRKATAKAYTNGVEFAMPTTAFACNYNANSSGCAALKVGDNVQCAGLRVDDAVIDDTATMKAWAVNTKYVEQLPPPPSKESVWTGAAGDGDPTNAENWEGGKIPDDETLVKMGGEVYLNAVEGQTFVCQEIVFTNDVTLTGTCDWSAIPVAPNTKEFVLDVNGNGLTLTKTLIGTITDGTEAVPPGTLTFNVAEGETVTNTLMSIQGNIQFVKEGAGTFDGRLANQLFTGGTVVNEGVITSNESETNLHWGKKGSEVRVEPNGVLDVKNNLSWCYHKIILNGGVISNATGNTKSEVQGIGDVELLADSKVITKFHLVFSDNQTGKVGVINLGGHTLEFVHLTSPDDKSLFYFYNSVVSNGTLRFDQRAKFNPRKATCMGEDVTLDMQGDFFLSGCDITVMDFIDGSKGDTQTLENDRRVYVTGRYTPASTNLVNVGLKDGATLDLNGQEGVWTFVNTLTPQTIVYEEGATITVDVSKRDVEDGDQLIAWETAPTGVVFVPDETTAGKELGVVIKADGLYCSMDAVVTAYWTNADDDNDFANPNNWACTNAAGEAAEGKIPGDATTVYFTGDKIPDITDTVEWLAVSVNGTLGDNCDWSGLGETPILAGSFVDVNGNNWTLAKVFEGTVTNSTDDVENPGTFTIFVDEDETVDNTMLALTGNLKLVKDGAGTFVPSVKAQTYTGGTVVNEGIIKASSAENDGAKGNRLGANDTDIIVNAGGTFDINGKGYWSNHDFVLNGGILANYGAFMNGFYKSGGNGIHDVRLESDSFIEVAYGTVFGLEDAVIELNGHTLTVSHVDTKSAYDCLYMRSTIQNGTFRFGPKVQMWPIYANVFGENLTVESYGDFRRGDNALTVKNILDASANISADPSSKSILNVTGTFTPNTLYFQNVTLTDGATLNLSDKTEPWSTTSALTSTPQTVTFADGATIAVDVSGRELEEGDKIIAWDARPSATFAFAGYEGGLLAFPELDGLYARSTSTEVDKGYWTGAAGDGDPLNPANWACTNSAGQVVTEAIPTNAAASIVIRNLTTDLDWTGLGAVNFAEGEVDLAGHTLTLAAFAETSAALVTNTVEALGKVKVDVGEGASSTLGGSTICGNIALDVLSGTFQLTTSTGITGGNPNLVTVCGGATLDENGVIDMPLALRLEDGATLTNTGTAHGASSAQFTGGLELSEGATAYIDTPNQMALTASGYATMPISIGNGTLVKRGAGKISIQNGAITGTGKILVEAGELNLGYKGLDVADTVTIEVKDNAETSTYIWVEATCSIPRITGNGRIAASSASLTVTKYFSGLLQIGQQGGGNQFKNGTLTLGDGATLDLTEVEGVWTQHAKVVFGENAAVTVDLTGRTIAQGDQIIAWTAQPPATAKILSKGADVYFVRKDDGLYAARASMIFVR